MPPVARAPSRCSAASRPPSTSSIVIAGSDGCSRSSSTIGHAGRSSRRSSRLGGRERDRQQPVDAAAHGERAEGLRALLGVLHVEAGSAGSSSPASVREMPRSRSITDGWVKNGAITPTACVRPVESARGDGARLVVERRDRLEHAPARVLAHRRRAVQHARHGADTDAGFCRHFGDRGPPHHLSPPPASVEAVPIVADVSSEARRDLVAQPGESYAPSVRTSPAARCARRARARTPARTGCGAALKLASSRSRSPACSRARPKTWSLPVQTRRRRGPGRARRGRRGARRERAQARPQPALDGRRVGAPLGGLPVHRGPVQPAVVVAVRGVAAVAAVVAQTQLVAHVDQRQAAVGERDRMQQQDAPHAPAPRRPGRRARAPPRARRATRWCRSCAPRRSAARAGSGRRARTCRGTRRRRSRPGSGGAGGRPRRPRRRPPRSPPSRCRRGSGRRSPSRRPAAPAACSASVRVISATRPDASALHSSTMSTLW